MQWLLYERQSRAKWKHLVAASSLFWIGKWLMREKMIIGLIHSVVRILFKTAVFCTALKQVFSRLFISAKCDWHIERAHLHDAPDDVTEWSIVRMYRRIGLQNICFCPALLHVLNTNCFIARLSLTVTLLMPPTLINEWHSLRQQQYQKMRSCEYIEKCTLTKHHRGNGPTNR